MAIGRSVLSTLVTILLISVQHKPSAGSAIRNRRSTSDPPWASPCESTTTTTDAGISFNPIESSLSDLADELHLRSLEAHSLSMALKDLFFEHRLSSSNNLAQILEVYHLPNYPLPADVIIWTHQNHTGDVVKQDYVNLSTALVYLEAIKYDEIEHHNSSLVADISAVERKFLSVLCILDSIITRLGLSVNSHVTRDIMPDTLREITSTTERHKRDYIMAKDSVHLMTSTKASHMAMKLGL